MSQRSPFLIIIVQIFTLVFMVILLLLTRLAKTPTDVDRHLDDQDVILKEILNNQTLDRWTYSDQVKWQTEMLKLNPELSIPMAERQANDAE